MPCESLSFVQHRFDDVRRPGHLSIRASGRLSLNLGLTKRTVGAAFAAAALLAAGTAVWPSAASATSGYLPGVVIVGYDQPGLSAAADQANAAAVNAGAPPASIRTRVIHLRPGMTVSAELRRLQRQRGVAFAVPDYLAHIAGGTPPGSPPAWIPDDPGKAGYPGGWQQMQWNFLAGAGVNAPEAWANLLAVHRGGARDRK